MSSSVIKTTSGDGEITDTNEGKTHSLAEASHWRKGSNWAFRLLEVSSKAHFLVPKTGARLISASDGLWDVLSFGKAAKLSRPKSARDASNALMAAVTKDLRCLDDTSIFIIDVLPDENTSFPKLALRAGTESAGEIDEKTLPLTKKASSGGLFACFKPAIEDMLVVDIPLSTSRFQFIADVDCMKAYPGLKALLDANSLDRISRAFHAPKPQVANHITNYTLHGGNLFGPNGEAPRSNTNCPASAPHTIGVPPTRSSARAKVSSLSSTLKHEVPQKVTSPEDIRVPFERSESSGAIPYMYYESEREIYARLTASSHAINQPHVSSDDEALVRKVASHGPTQ
eukprot:gene5306-18550_t